MLLLLEARKVEALGLNLRQAGHLGTSVLFKKYPWNAKLGFSGLENLSVSFTQHTPTLLQRAYLQQRSHSRTQ